MQTASNVIYIEGKGTVLLKHYINKKLSRLTTLGSGQGDVEQGRGDEVLEGKVADPK